MNHANCLDKKLLLTQLDDLRALLLSHEITGDNLKIVDRYQEPVLFISLDTPPRHEEFIDLIIFLATHCKITAIEVNTYNSIGINFYESLLEFKKTTGYPVEHIYGVPQLYPDGTSGDAQDTVDQSFPKDEVKVDDPVTETVLDEASRLTSGDRKQDYGHAYYNMKTTAELWSIIIGAPVTARQVALCQIGTKLARELHKTKRDNIVDIAGYARVYEMILEKEEELQYSTTRIDVEN